MASNSQIARLRRPGAQRRGQSQRLGGRPQAGNACFRAKAVPIEIIALILGHEDIAITYAFYLHADMRAAEQAIALVAPPKTKPGRYRAPDPLLAFLEGL